jgi:hypothetical protein
MNADNDLTAKQRWPTCNNLKPGALRDVLYRDVNHANTSRHPLQYLLLFLSIPYSWKCSTLPLKTMIAHDHGHFRKHIVHVVF